jgi:ATP-dependent helicase/nuclease subunit B
MKRSNGCRTQFLGWDRPLLLSVVDYLWDQHSEDAEASGQWRLSNLLAVLPTQRSGRRLRELLQREAELRGLNVQSPRIITVGDLPEFLYQPAESQLLFDDAGLEDLPTASTKLADELERTLAWADVLEHSEAGELEPLFPVLPSRDSLTPWLEMAATVRRLHDDLAAAELSFADVATELASEEATVAERGRWNLLQSLFERYLLALARGGRRDPSTARAAAVATGDCYSEYHILLIGTSDLSGALRAMLKATCERQPKSSKRRSGSLTALVAAESEHRDHFDSFGSIIASRWCQWQLPLRDSQLTSASDATDQAAIAAHWAAEIREQYQPDEITIGVTDESLVPPVEVELRHSEQSTFRELGWSFSQTPVGRLLELLVTHLAQQSWQSLAALIRHADVYDFIDAAMANRQLAETAKTKGKAAKLGDAEKHEKQSICQEVDKTQHHAEAQYINGGWLVSLDAMLAEHYPTRLDVPLSQKLNDCYSGAFAAMEIVGESLTAFTATKRLPISRWAAELERWLGRIYPGDDQPADGAVDKSLSDTAAAQRLRVAIASSRKTLQRMQKLHRSFDVKVNASTAIELLANRLLEQRVSDVGRGDAISIVGWLDLALEDSPAMAIVGVNQPYVPEAVTADPFLPGNLRTRLRMSDNERRLGRDIYALQLILATRPETRLIVGRTGVDGSPTPPSRLLAAAEPRDVARRLVWLLDDEAIHRSRQATQKLCRRWDTLVQRTRLPIPILDRTHRVQTMSVTSFTAYLACPYRFYLRHVLKLGPVDDGSRELAANQFGDLVHNSLEFFAKSEAKDEAQERTIEEAMLAALDSIAAEHLGSAPAPAVKLQIEQARRRLRQVAKVQAERRRAGWHIWRAEASVGEENNAGIDVDGQRMIIRGRFDRIDRHDDGNWAILDYKTHGHLPRKKHLRKVGDAHRWVELQLPIYRRMIPYLVGDDVDPQQVALGYFNVSEKESETRINEADFTAAEYASADELIVRCIRDIWAGRFEPSEDPVMYDDYAMILQSGVSIDLLESLEGDPLVTADAVALGSGDWRED